MSKRIPCKRCSGKGYIYVTYIEGNTGTATSHICPECCGAGVQFVPTTNADRIRAMSDEELAAWLVEKTGYQESAFSSPSYLNFLTDADDTKEAAIKGTVKWLKQPVEEEQK